MAPSLALAVKAPGSAHSATPGKDEGASSRHWARDTEFGYDRDERLRWESLLQPNGWLRDGRVGGPLSLVMTPQ